MSLDSQELRLFFSIAQISSRSVLFIGTNKEVLVMLHNCLKMSEYDFVDRYSFWLYNVMLYVFFMRQIGNLNIPNIAF